MKYFLILFGFFLAVVAHGQVLDTAQVRMEVDSLIEVTRGLVKERKFEEAIQVIEVAKDKSERAFGEMSVEYADCVFNYGRIYHFQNIYEQAISFYTEVINTLRKIDKKEHHAYRGSLNNLGNVYFKMGNYDKAEKIHLATKNNREKILGKNNPDYASTLNNLGILYFKMGNYDEAEKNHLEAKEIRKKVLVKNHPDYASTLNNLGILYRKTGNYQEAKKNYLEAKKIWKKALGTNHPDYTQILNNLGNLYFKMGNYDKAEKIHLETKKIREKILGKNDPDYAKSLNNLGWIYCVMGNYKESEKSHIAAKEIRRKLLGINHPDYAESLNDLGNLYFKMDNYEEAKKVYLIAKEIRKKELGENHPDYAESLSNLGNIYLEIGSYDKAKKNHIESKTIREKELGKNHPDYAESLQNLANVYFKMKNYDEAEKFYLEAYKMCVQQINTAFSFLSNQEKENFVKTKIEPLINQLQEAVFKIQSTKLYDMQYNLALLTKGLQLQTDISTLKFILTENDSTLLKDYDELLDIRRYLSRQYERPIIERDSTLVVGKENRQQELEKSLAHASTEFRATEELYKINFKTIQKSLKKNEAAIEFIHFNKPNTDSIIYAAAILLPSTENVHYIPLFEEKALDSLAIHKGSTVEFTNQLYRGNNSEGVIPKNKQQLSQQLYKLIWQPLDSLLEGE